jgi:hypothetical protein
MSTKHPPIRATRLALTCGLLAALACGCNEDKGTATTAAPGTTAAATAAPGPTGETQTAKAPAATELEEVTNDKLGYAIKLPKGAETQMSDANGGMYSKDTMIIKVEPSGVALATADDVLRGVNTDGGTVEKKEEGNLLMAIVTRSDGPLNVYAGPKGAKVQSHCMAEPSQKDLAVKICSSLQAKK